MMHLIHLLAGIGKTTSLANNILCFLSVIPHYIIYLCLPSSATPVIPASPYIAASIAAFKAKRLVCDAILFIVSVIAP
ncbi:hypothetical protein LGL08_09955 [Clostridium estertheticum]|nr:hypothetical protein [Clostridium estertheticum]MCB2344963.1 hypothetical protein [Clostridium estertheticum]MCB2349875.1 hypothetical protein [Clostridium estertheticum]